MTDADSAPSLAAEVQRAAGRREALGVQRPAGHADRPWALALSGGGIRSATFCLGVLQGLATTPAPPGCKPPAVNGPVDSPDHGAPLPLLAQFDVLSTVSGGGYVGAFFSSLFVRGRLAGDAGETDAAAAQRAYRALADEPPERMHADTAYDPARPGRAALAWLRDNGRYLAPSGSGDMTYAAAIAIRNWFATQFVIATLLLPLLSASLLLRLLLAGTDAGAGLEAALRPTYGDWLWPSATWIVVAAVLVAGALPFGIAFWFTHARPPRRADAAAPLPAPAPFSVAALAAGALGLVWIAIAVAGAHRGGDAATRTPFWALLLALAGALTVAGVAVYVVTVAWLRPPTVAALRVHLTRGLTRTLTLALAIGVLALVETLAQSALVIWQGGGLWAAGGAGGMAAALVWGVRFVARQLEARPGTPPAWRQLPLGVLAGALGVLLWLLVAVALDIAVLIVAAGPEAAGPAAFAPAAAAALQPLVAGMVALLLLTSWLTGRFPGFLNLSSLQGYYSARLTRAYLGASNGQRFRAGARRAHSVAEPVTGDEPGLAALYANACAPLHLINVCLNQTVDPAEQLVQRDRKGKPLAVSQGGFYLDGQPHPMPGSGGATELDAALTAGEWIGVSGAAVSTGLGRSTSLGTSLLLGFANVRLGRWWRSGVGAEDGWLARIFRSQFYLLDEIRGTFHGTRRPYQYLSDGGHFENTGAYELLRPGRDVALIVVCDCGADPDYLFDDLANLIRLARIDHGIEIRVNREVTRHFALSEVFAAPESFRRAPDGTPPPESGRCAVLLDVHAPSAGGARGDPAALRLAARIVLLKPVALAAAAADVQNYDARHAAFPQQSTADQFFDEAQWESHRRLGLEAARRVFPQDADSDYAHAFWQALRVPGGPPAAS